MRSETLVCAFEKPPLNEREKCRFFLKAFRAMKARLCVLQWRQVHGHPDREQHMAFPGSPETVVFLFSEEFPCRPNCRRLRFGVSLNSS